jgi:DNA polymerase III sliding clamp (beta) subunit (PCNA family)
MKKCEVIRALEFLNNKTVDKVNRLFWVTGANINGLKESIQVPGTPSNVTAAGFDIVEALRIIKLLDGDEIEFTKDSVTDGTENLLLFPKQEGPIPEFPCDYEYCYDGKTFLDAIKKTKFAIGGDPRFNLNNFYIENNLFIATDGHRLAWSDVSADDNNPCTSLMPRSVAFAVEKFKPEMVFISVRENSNYFCLVTEAADGQTITVEIMGEKGDYPDYQRVMPDYGPDNWFAVDRKDLQTKLAPVAKILQPDQTKGTCVVNGSLKITANFIGKTIEFPITDKAGEYAGPTNEGVFLLNLKYLLQAVEQTKKETLYVSMSFKEDGEASGKPMVLRFDNPSAQWRELNEGSLIMPLRR